MTENKRHTHVKVASYVLGHNGQEIILPLSGGGEVQLWERLQWERYHECIERNPSLRGTQYYRWTYVEDITPVPGVDLARIVLLPEKTGGKEFQINTNAKN